MERSSRQLDVEVWCLKERFSLWYVSGVPLAYRGCSCNQRSERNRGVQYEQTDRDRIQGIASFSGTRSRQRNLEEKWAEIRRQS